MQLQNIRKTIEQIQSAEEVVDLQYTKVGLPV